MSGECRECGHIAPDHRDDCPVTGMYNAAVDALSSILGMTFIPYRSPAPSSSLPMPSQEEPKSELQREKDRARSYKDLWDQSCQAVSELCDLAGAPYGSMHDLWTLKAAIERLKSKADAADGSSKEPAPITHVAIRWRGQVWSLPRPYRHHHIIQVIAFLTTSAEREDGVDCSESRGDQGFLDATGKYLDRRSALGVALENDQVLDRSDIRAGMLFSEDLW